VPPVAASQTPAWAIPVLEEVAHRIVFMSMPTQPRKGLPLAQPWALALVPTRELAISAVAAIQQVLEQSKDCVPIKVSAVYGGTPMNEVCYIADSLIIVATPGRLFHLIKRKEISLSNLEWFIVEEADTMLSKSFQADVDRLIKPKTGSVSRINPSFVGIAIAPSMNLEVKRKLCGYFGQEQTSVVTIRHKSNEGLLWLMDFHNAPYPYDDRLEYFEHVLSGWEGENSYDPKKEQLLIFVDSMDRAKRLSKDLAEILSAECVRSTHKGKAQREREEALAWFLKGGPILVTTARTALGLGFPLMPTVICFDIPPKYNSMDSWEGWMSQVSRTGRIGHSGKVVTLIDPSRREDKKVLPRMGEWLENNGVEPPEWMKMGSASG
jgi:ATP-dependent RNA helicase RhlE